MATLQHGLLLFVTLIATAYFSSACAFNLPNSEGLQARELLSEFEPDYIPPEVDPPQSNDQEPATLKSSAIEEKLRNTAVPPTEGPAPDSHVFQEELRRKLLSEFEPDYVPPEVDPPQSNDQEPATLKSSAIEEKLHNTAVPPTEGPAPDSHVFQEELRRKLLSEFEPDYVPPEVDPPQSNDQEPATLKSSAIEEKLHNTAVPPTEGPAPDNHVFQEELRRKLLSEFEPDYVPPEVDPPQSNDQEPATLKSSAIEEKLHNTAVPPTEGPAPDNHVFQEELRRKLLSEFKTVDIFPDYLPPEADPPTSHDDYQHPITMKNYAIEETPLNTAGPPTGGASPDSQGDNHFFQGKPRNTKVPPTGVASPVQPGDNYFFQEKPRNTKVPPTGVASPVQPGNNYFFQEKPRNTEVPQTGAAAQDNRGDNHFFQLKPHDTPVTPTGGAAPSNFIFQEKSSRKLLSEFKTVDIFPDYLPPEADPPTANHYQHPTTMKNYAIEEKPRNKADPRTGGAAPGIHFLEDKH